MSWHDDDIAEQIEQMCPRPMPWEQCDFRPELQRDAAGFYPGEAETGIPDFLRTFVAAGHANCTICAGEPSSGFYTGCMVKDGHAPEWNCDGRGNLTRKPSPANSLPASPPNWAPPWVSKS